MIKSICVIKERYEKIKIETKQIKFILAILLNHEYNYLLFWYFFPFKKPFFSVWNTKNSWHFFAKIIAKWRLNSKADMQSQNQRLNVFLVFFVYRICYVMCWFFVLITWLILELIDIMFVITHVYNIYSVQHPLLLWLSMTSLILDVRDKKSEI